MKSRDFKTPILTLTLCLPVSELSDYRIRKVCLANDLVLPKFVQGARTETLDTHR